MKTIQSFHRTGANLIHQRKPHEKMLLFQNGGGNDQVDRLAEGLDDLFCAISAVALVLHGAPGMEISNEIPPDPGPPGLIPNSVNAELPQVLDHHILAIVPLAEVLLGIRAEPGDVARRELSEASPLKQLRVALEVLDEAHLIVAPRAALVVAVGPELVLHPLVGVRHRLPPIQLYDHQLVPLRQRLLEGRSELAVDERGGDVDLVDVLRVLAFLRVVHGEEGLVDVVSDQNCGCASLLCVPCLQSKVTIWSK